MITEDKIHLAFVCVLALSIGLVGGFFFKPLFLLAGMALAGYLWIHKRYLRCPKCGGFENLDRLFYAKRFIARLPLPTLRGDYQNKNKVTGTAYIAARSAKCSGDRWRILLLPKSPKRTVRRQMPLI